MTNGPGTFPAGREVQQQQQQRHVPSSPGRGRGGLAQTPPPQFAPGCWASVACKCPFCPPSLPPSLFQIPAINPALPALPVGPSQSVNIRYGRCHTWPVAVPLTQLAPHSKGFKVGVFRLSPWETRSFTHSCIIEHLLCAKPCTSCCGYKAKDMLLPKACLSLRRQTHKQAVQTKSVPFRAVISRGCPRRRG